MEPPSSEAVTNLPTAPDTVWAYVASPVPLSPPSFSATISALTELTNRGLVPFVVLGFFPEGVYSGTKGEVPTNAPGSPYENSPYGPSPAYMSNNPDDWETILQNWNTLIQAFFQALKATFGSAIKKWWFEVWNERSGKGRLC